MHVLGEPQNDDVNHCCSDVSALYKVPCFSLVMTCVPVSNTRSISGRVTSLAVTRLLRRASAASSTVGTIVPAWASARETSGRGWSAIFGVTTGGCSCNLPRSEIRTTPGSTSRNSTIWPGSISIEARLVLVPCMTKPVLTDVYPSDTTCASVGSWSGVLEFIAWVPGPHSDTTTHNNTPTQRFCNPF